MLLFMFGLGMRQLGFTPSFSGKLLRFLVVTVLGRFFRLLDKRVGTYPGTLQFIGLFLGGLGGSDGFQRICCTVRVDDSGREHEDQ